MTKGDGVWPRLPTVLLCVSLLTTAALALHAHSVFTYHRVTAEQVLRDFASLAGTEFVRRSASQLAYEGYMTLLASLARESSPHEGETDRTRLATTLARRTFRAAPRERSLRFSPDSLSPETSAWLLGKLGEAAPGGHPFVVVSGVTDGAFRRFVYGPGAGDPRSSIVGFELDSSRIGPYLEGALKKGPLLPSFLGHGRVGNDAIHLVVRDASGRDVFHWGRGTSSELSARVPYGDTYSKALDGAVVFVALDRDAARNLVIGGLPRSRLPLVLGLVAVSAGLVVAALLQLRRERALERLRLEFVASVSHELRTPLTQIRMFAETLLLERVRSPEESRRALEIVDREARRLTNLVENVLQFSRGERGAVRLETVRQPLAPLVGEVLDPFRPVAGAGVTFVARLDEDATAVVDADAFRQILLNLLDNAVKYGPANQRVTVEVLGRGEVVAVSVEDEGPGVPREERRRVFDAFHRGELPRAANVSGTGIGLAVVRDLAERMGGRAFVKDAPGGGARFVVELPS